MDPGVLLALAWPDHCVRPMTPIARYAPGVPALVAAKRSRVGVVET
jgi:hypothetical protein